MKELANSLMLGISLSAALQGGPSELPTMPADIETHTCASLEPQALYRALYGVALTGAHAGEPFDSTRMAMDIKEAAVVAGKTINVGIIPHMQIETYEPYTVQRKYYNGSPASRDSPGMLAGSAALDMIVAETTWVSGFDVNHNFTASAGYYTTANPNRRIPGPYEADVNETRGLVEVSVIGQDCGQLIDDPR